MISFAEKLNQHNINASPLSIETFQVNITKLCNQACLHCHVNSSPIRREMMSKKNIDLSLKILDQHHSIKILDITGGAPELHPLFKYFVKGAVGLQKKIMIRHNLTVTHDPHPMTQESMSDLPDFFLENKVEIVSSLPYYDSFFTDKQRGMGVFEKSIKSLQMLNERGYGIDPNLPLNLVYNPVGPYLPPSQKDLESKYKEVLYKKYGITFNQLFTITNMPIKRFAEDLKRKDQYEMYMEKLFSSFNPQAVNGIMCRSMISVDHDGNFFDCDFNQMLNLKLNSSVQHLKDFSQSKLLQREIVFASHCYGCTAGSGSSCGGTTA